MPVLIRLQTRDGEWIYFNAADIYRVEEWKTGDERGARIIRGCGCWLDVMETPESVCDMIDFKIRNLWR